MSRITLSEILEHLGIGPGDQLAVEKPPYGRIEIKAFQPTGKISDAFDFLAREDGPSLTIDEMNEIIAQGWARKF
jgi:hypothetical protein